MENRTKELSNCCKAPVHVHSADEGTSYYECKACWRACDLHVPGINNQWIKSNIKLPVKECFVWYATYNSEEADKCWFDGERFIMSHSASPYGTDITKIVTHWMPYKSPDLPEQE